MYISFSNKIVNYITYILWLFPKFRAKLDIVLVTAQNSKHPQILATTLIMYDIVLKYEPGHDITSNVACDKCRLRRACAAFLFKLKNSKCCSVSILTLRVFKRLAKALSRLHVCAGWSEPLRVAHTTLLEISCRGSIIKQSCLRKNTEKKWRMSSNAISYGFYYACGINTS